MSTLSRLVFPPPFVLKDLLKSVPLRLGGKKRLLPTRDPFFGLLESRPSRINPTGSG